MAKKGWKNSVFEHFLSSFPLIMGLFREFHLAKNVFFGSFWPFWRFSSIATTQLGVNYGHFQHLSEDLLPLAKWSLECAIGIIRTKWPSRGPILGPPRQTSSGSRGVDFWSKMVNFGLRGPLRTSVTLIYLYEIPYMSGCVNNMHNNSCGTSERYLNANSIYVEIIVFGVYLRIVP